MTREEWKERLPLIQAFAEMKKYHVDYSGEVVTQDNGEPVPSYICICGAYEPSECGCGAWDIDIDEWHELYDNSEVVE